MSKKGSFAQAIDKDRAIEHMSTALLYNQGYALYGLGKYDEALVCFRTAQLNANGQLASKVEHAVVATQNKLGAEQDSDLYQLILKIQNGMSLLFMQFLFLLHLALLLFFFFKKRWKLFIVFNCVALVLIVRLAAYYYVHIPYLIVTAQQANIFVGPHEKFNTIAVLPRGTEVKLVDENDSWCKMLYRGSAGWVQRENVQIIKDHS